MKTIRETIHEIQFTNDTIKGTLSIRFRFNELKCITLISNEPITIDMLSKLTYEIGFNLKIGLSSPILDTLTSSVISKTSRFSIIEGVIIHYITE